jgi:DNA-directed RNA polymerase specialized sigma24 family protein
VVFRLEIADFGAFYERTYSTAYRTALGIIREPAVVADVTQEAHVGAYRHRQRYRGDVPSTSWLCRIVVNQARAALRRRRADWNAPVAAALELHRGAFPWCVTRSPDSKYLLYRAWRYPNGHPSGPTTHTAATR